MGGVKKGEDRYPKTRKKLGIQLFIYTRYTYIWMLWVAFLYLLGAYLKM